MKIKLLTIVLVAFVSACTTPHYQDLRSPEEKRASLALATSKLEGSYEILERRGGRSNNEGGMVIVAVKENIIKVGILNENQKTYEIAQGIDCDGSARIGYEYIMCSRIRNSGINFFVISKDHNGKTVKHGALIPVYSPMEIGKEEYLLEINMRGSGRNYYYRLKKHVIPHLNEIE